MKRTDLSLALLMLLAAAGCHRQPSDTSAASAPEQVAATEDKDAVRHDPHAMTAIDVAIGDLAGFANYAGGRADAPAPSRAGPTAAAANLPTIPLASVLSGDEPVGEQPSAIPGSPSTPAKSGQTAAPGGPAGPGAP